MMTRVESKTWVRYFDGGKPVIKSSVMVSKGLFWPRMWFEHPVLLMPMDCDSLAIRCRS